VPQKNKKQITLKIILTKIKEGTIFLIVDLGSPNTHL